MVNYAINLGMWTILFFILGMYKPQWPLFFLKKPNRFIIVVITTILVMITLTLYGEGTRRFKLEQATKLPVPQDVAPAVPVPVPETPVTK